MWMIPRTPLRSPFSSLVKVGGPLQWEENVSMETNSKEIFMFSHFLLDFEVYSVENPTKVKFQGNKNQFECFQQIFGVHLGSPLQNG